MTDIIIDETQAVFLVKKLKEIFNPFVISEGIETVLTFDNDLGKGCFRIITMRREILNIYFEGELKEPLQFKFFNARRPILNFIYLNSGKLGVAHNNFIADLAINETQQAIFNSNIKDYEIITWPGNIYVEFNFLKLFDLSYLKSKPLSGALKTVISENEVIEESFVVKAGNSDKIDQNTRLLHTTMVGDQRMRDLENQVVNLLDIQINEITKDY